MRTYVMVTESLAISERRLVAIGILSLTGASVAMTIWHVFVTVGLGWEYPWSTPFFRPEDRFMDYFNGLDRGVSPFTELRPDHGNFPFFMFFFYVFAALPPSLGLTIYLLSFFLFVFEMFRRSLDTAGFSRRKALGLAFLGSVSSYPVLFLLDRANIEGIVFFLLVAGVYFFASGKFIRSAVLIGLAGAMKPFPLIFLLLFLKPMRWKPVVLSLVVVATVSVVSMAVFPTPFGEKVSTMTANLASYETVYVHGDEGVYFGSSLFGAAKIYAKWVGRWTNWPKAAEIYRWGVLIAALLAIPVLHRLRDLPSQVLLLTTMMVLFPHVSAHYRLIYFLLPLWLFIAAKDWPRDGLLLWICMLSLFVFKGYFRLMGTEMNTDSVLNPALMCLVMLVLILRGFGGVSKALFRSS